jgi:Contact-dependent growth inhibition CdiA C-terminal domain
MAIEEEKAAHALSDMGYKVKFNDGQISRDRMLKEGLDPGRVPDLEVNGKIFDIYSPVSRDPKAAVQGVIDKIDKGQTHRVVINVSGEAGAPEKLKEITDRLRAINPNGLHEVLAVKITGGNSELVRIFP